METPKSATHSVIHPIASLGPSTMPTSEPVALATRAFGSELPIFDPEAFGRTTSFLAPEAVARHMQTIAGLSEALLCALQEADAVALVGDRLVGTAHTLAGSVGMFGFQRLASACRRFEHAAQAGAEEAPALAEELAAAVQTALPEIRLRAPANVDPSAELRQNPR
jgi:HPt (histidine-containing phosphotransfer) domain-containing protein